MAVNIINMKILTGTNYNNRNCIFKAVTTEFYVINGSLTFDKLSSKKYFETNKSYLIRWFLFKTI